MKREPPIISFGNLYPSKMKQQLLVFYKKSKIVGLTLKQIPYKENKKNSGQHVWKCTWVYVSICV